MLFNTLEYLVFFIVVLIVAWLLAGHRPVRNLFLLVASFYFYVSNNHWQILLLLLTTTIDYFLCLKMEHERSHKRRKTLLVISLVSNLGVLFYFKYYNFAGASAAAFLSFLGVRMDWVDVNILLPVGISFFTFEALSYTIDVYRGDIKVERRWSRLAFLVSFFPHLIAGPIVRARQFFPQMDEKPRLNLKTLDEALYLIGAGLVKKLVLADMLAIYADAAFNAAGTASQKDLLLGIYAFSFQIFFDFSGYSDIARGSAKLLGFELVVNFLRPYTAASLTEFWRRWHISFSTWLRDYLYIPLGGNKMATRFGVYRNLFLTMLLGGIWHGAAWHFVAWGVLHGLALMVERATGLGTSDAPMAFWRRLPRAILVFHVVTLIWVPFRANNIGDAVTMLRRLFLPDPSCCDTLTNGMAAVIAVTLGAWLWQMLTEYVDLRGRFLALPVPMKAMAYAGVTVAVFVMTSEAPKSFLYFQF